MLAWSNDWGTNVASLWLRQSPVLGLWTKHCAYAAHHLGLLFILYLHDWSRHVITKTTGSNNRPKHCAYAAHPLGLLFTLVLTWLIETRYHENDSDLLRFTQCRMALNFSDAEYLHTSVYLTSYHMYLIWVISTDIFRLPFTNPLIYLNRIVKFARGNISQIERKQ